MARKGEFFPIDSDWLCQRYVNDGLSLAEVAREAGCSHFCIQTNLKRLGIPTRNPGKPIHGHRGRGSKETTPTYRTWLAMITRCTNPNYEHFDLYGGRGITVCDRWRTFENFLIDMGERPEGTTLDRIDNDRGYYFLNCRWATVKEQALNRRRKTHCKRGHEFTEANTYVYKNGKRGCRACGREFARARRASQ